MAVGLVLADSSIAVLALPAIHREFQIAVDDIASVLTSFNLSLAIAAIPAAFVVRRTGARRASITGLVLFAIASAGCALASGFGPLIAWRCIQAVGGAAAVMGALSLLAAATHHVRAVALWTAAGSVGAALGPAIGGALTETLSWQAVFAAQIPLALIPLPLLLGAPEASRRAAASRIPWAPVAALAFASAGLAAALFLVVLLLVEGWHMSPLEAAAAVTVLPAAAIGTTAVFRRAEQTRPRALAGVLLVAGGLAALGLLPRAGWGWTVPPQILVGAGLSLALASMTYRALAGDASELPSGTTIAARHAGVVLGLVLLSPVLVADLQNATDVAQQAGTALLIDARISAAAKTQLAEAIFDRLESSAGRTPDLGPAFRSVDTAPDERSAFLALEDRVAEMLERVAGASFSRSFLFAAVLSGAALVPLMFVDRTRP